MPYRENANAPEPEVVPLPRLGVLARAPVRALVILMAFVAPWIGLNLYIGLLDGARLAPGVEAVEDVAAFATLATFLALALDAKRRVFPALASTRRRVVYGILVAAFHLFFVWLAACAVVLTRSHWLFGGTCIATATSPQGRVAYLYRESFLSCTYGVYIREPWSPASRRAHSKAGGSGGPCTSTPSTLQWNDDGTAVRLVSPSGREIELTRP